MNKNIIYILTFFFVTGIALQSCEKKDSNRIEPSVPNLPLAEYWRIDQRFEDVPFPFEGVRLNLFATDKNLFLHGPSRFDRVDLNGNFKGYSVFNENAIKFPVNEDLHFDYDENNSFAFKANDPIAHSVAGDFIINIDSTLIGLKTPTSQRDPLGTINQFNHAVIPFQSIDGIKILLIGIDGNGNSCNGCSFNVDFTKTIPLADLGGATNMGSPSSIDGHFFIPTSNGVFKLDTLGSYQKVLNDSEIKTIFDAGDFIGACGNNNNGYISNDGGDSWQSTSGFPISLRDAHFQMIGDSLIAYNEKLFTLNWFEGQWKPRLLEMDSLMNPYITSLAKFNDTIFISTLNGVYKKSTRSFYD